MPSTFALDVNTFNHSTRFLTKHYLGLRTFILNDVLQHHCNLHVYPHCTCGKVSRLGLDMIQALANREIGWLQVVARDAACAIPSLDSGSNSKL